MTCAVTFGWHRRRWAGCTGLGVSQGAQAADSRPGSFCPSERRRAPSAQPPAARAANDLDLRKTLAPGPWVGLLARWRWRSCCRCRQGTENPCPVVKGRCTPAGQRGTGDLSLTRVLRLSKFGQGDGTRGVFCVWASRVVRTRKTRKSLAESELRAPWAFFGAPLPLRSRQSQ